jgi:hypothetical protein
MEWNDIMALTNSKWEMLRRIVQRPITHADMATDKELSDTQELTNLGYVKDYGQQHGRRIPVHLRIWGITPAGRAALEQQALVENKGRQTSLTLLKRPGLTIKTSTLLRHTKLEEKKKSPSEILVEEEGEKS